MVAASAFIGLGTAFFQPASGGFITEIVAREQLGRTNGVLRTANALAMVIGPAIGGASVVAIGPGWGIALDAASYIASALCLLAIRLPVRAQTASPTRQSVSREMGEAVTVMRTNRWLCLLVIQYGMLNMLAIAPFKVIAPVLLSRTPGGAGAWGTLLSAIGVGAAMLSVLTITAIQREIASSMLSRIMAMVQWVDLGLAPLGYVLAGPVMGILGTTSTLLLSGISVLAGVGVLCCQHDIRHFEHRLL